MNTAEQQARTVVLAQALEVADAQGELLGLDERKAASHAVLHNLQGSRLPAGEAAAHDAPDAQLLALRARHLIDALALKHPTLAALERPSPLWPWLGMAVPLLALFAGIFTDRITNPHRVDLLSVPLLIVIAFNLGMYASLFALAVRRPSTTRPSVILALLQKMDTWRARQRGTRARVLTTFYTLWHAAAGRVIVYRCQAVLHVSAAAWAAGIALSLAVRGLVVEYRVGWESTFLGAAQVYRVLEVLFWLPGKVFRLTPLTLEQVASLRDFQGSGGAGDRWVWMYVGLLALAVVLPRLLLAAWAAWCARQQARQLALPLGAPYFQATLAGMRGTRLAIGVVVTGEHRLNQFLRLARGVADDPLAQRLAVSTPEGDRLQWVEEPDAQMPVDAVLCIGETSLFSADVPPDWAGAPLVALPEHRLADVWDQWPPLLRALSTGLGKPGQAGWSRLADTLAQQQQQRFEQSMAAVATYLADAASQLAGTPGSAAIDAARDALFLSLQQLHRLDRTTGRALEQKLVARYGPRGSIGTTTAAAASAATGATMGVAVDAATGFLTLGAGAALGALLGAGMGWAAAVWHKKGAASEMILRLTEAGLLLWLEFAHSVRMQSGGDDRRAAWPAEIARQVQLRKSGLLRLWNARAAGSADKTQGTGHAQNTGNVDPEALRLLSETAGAVLANLYPPPAAVDIVGQKSDF